MLFDLVVHWFSNNIVYIDFDNIPVCLAKFERNFTKRKFYFVMQFMSKRYFYFEMEGVEMKKFKSLKIRDMCHKKKKKNMRDDQMNSKLSLKWLPQVVWGENFFNFHFFTNLGYSFQTLTTIWFPYINFLYYWLSSVKHICHNKLWGECAKLKRHSISLLRLVLLVWLFWLIITSDPRNNKKSYPYLPFVLWFKCSWF